MITSKEKCKGCLYICDCCKKKSYSCAICKPFGKMLDLESGGVCRLTREEIRLAHKYKVGDKVRVIHELKSGVSYDRCKAVRDMVEFRGKDVTITKAYHNFTGKVRYHIKEDHGGWVWSEEMFE